MNNDKTIELAKELLKEPERKEPTEAEKRLAEMLLATSRLDQWEQAEIRYSVDKIHALLRKYHSSAALAIVQVSLEIAVQQGR